MRRYGMMLAIILLIVVNVVVLAGVAYNRSSEPLATITLTEREIPLTSYGSYSDRENTGLSLRLDWSTLEVSPPHRFHLLGRHNNSENSGWFDKAKLQAIGFDCSMPLDAPGAHDYYLKMSSRKTYAVLEYEGTAWASWLANEKSDLDDAEKKARGGTISQDSLKFARWYFEREERTHSRLFVVDVSNDPKALGKQYGNQGHSIVLPAIVRLDYYPEIKADGSKKFSPRIMGRVSEIAADTIHIPKKQRNLFEKLLRERIKQMKNYERYTVRERKPAYEVTLHVGKRHEPWIAAIRESASR